MAIGWLAAFKAVPWPQVIAAAPTVVKEARSLWQSARGQETPPVTPPQAGSGMRLDRAEQRIAELERHQAEGSALLKSLAEQNAALIAAVELLQTRVRLLLSGAVAIAALAAATALAVWLY